MALCFVFVSVVVVLTPTEAAVVAHLLHALAHLLNAVRDVKMRSENNENNVKMRFNVKMRSENNGG